MKTDGSEHDRMSTVNNPNSRCPAQKRAKTVVAGEAVGIAKKIATTKSGKRKHNKSGYSSFHERGDLALLSLDFLCKNNKHFCADNDKARMLSLFRIGPTDLKKGDKREYVKEKFRRGYVKPEGEVSTHVLLFESRIAEFKDMKTSFDRRSKNIAPAKLWEGGPTSTKRKSSRKEYDSSLERMELALFSLDFLCNNSEYFCVDGDKARMLSLFRIEDTDLRPGDKREYVKEKFQQGYVKKKGETRTHKKLFEEMKAVFNDMKASNDTCSDNIAPARSVEEDAGELSNLQLEQLLSDMQKDCVASGNEGMDILPEGWREFVDANGRTFYHNQDTCTSQWNHPCAMTMHLQEQIRQSKAAFTNENMQQKAHGNHDNWELGNIAQPRDENLNQDTMDFTPDSQKKQAQLPLQSEDPGVLSMDLVASIRSIELETPYSYLSDRFHPCLQLQYTLCRLRGDHGYDAQDTCAETNMALLEKLIKKEECGRHVELFESDLQIPFVEINPEREVLRDIGPYLISKFGLDHADMLLDSLKNNAYNQYVMRSFLKSRDKNYQGELRWGLVKSGMVFVVPCKPICCRYLTNASPGPINVLLVFGDFDGPMSVKIKGKKVHQHTSMGEREARHGEYCVTPPYPAEKCCLRITEPVAFAFVTPDCVVLCSRAKIDESLVKITPKKAKSKSAIINEFKHGRLRGGHGPGWEGLVLGYNVGYVVEASVNGGGEPISIELLEESTHVLAIPKIGSSVEGTLSAPTSVHSLTLRSEWYRTCKEHAMYESERLGENEVVEFMD